MLSRAARAGGPGYASLWMIRANPSVPCGLGLQGGRNSGRLRELQCTRLRKMACVAEFTLTATLGAFSRGRESFLIYLEVLDDASCGRHFHFIRGWRTGDKEERERRLAKRAAAGTLTRLGIVCTASCLPSAGCSLGRSLARSEVHSRTGTATTVPLDPRCTNETTHIRRGG
ncbi:hypothetical protein TcBrA4_0011220 [Trypanosoma cruzi]|nr:hypothetical protein TcBrA4_0011220 [Trypanosoma cruzi]